MNLDTLKSVRTVWFYPSHPCSKVSQLSFKWDLLSLWFSHEGKQDVNESLASLHTVRRWMGLGEQEMGLWERIKGMQILLNASQTLTRSWPMSHWGCITCGFPQMTHRYPQYYTCLTLIFPHTMFSSLCMLTEVERE